MPVNDSTLARMAGNIFAGLALVAYEADDDEYQMMLTFAARAAADLTDALAAQAAQRTDEPEP